MVHEEVSWSTVGGTCCLRKYSILQFVASVQLPISLGDLAKMGVESQVSEVHLAPFPTIPGAYLPLYLWGLAARAWSRAPAGTLVSVHLKLLLSPGVGWGKFP